MYYKLLNADLNDDEIYDEDTFDYGYFQLIHDEPFERVEYMIDVKVGNIELDLSVVYKFKVQCTAQELMKFDFQISSSGGFIVSPRVIEYFKKTFPQDVAFSDIVIETATGTVTEYRMMHFITFADQLGYDSEKSYSIRTPQLNYIHNPAYKDGIVPNGRIIVHEPGAKILINETDVLKLNEQGFIGFGYRKVKMA